MFNKKLLFIGALAGSFLLTSCENDELKEDSQSSKSTKTFTCSSESASGETLKGCAVKSTLWDPETQHNLRYRLFFDEDCYTASEQQQLTKSFKFACMKWMAYANLNLENTQDTPVSEHEFLVNFTRDGGGPCGNSHVGTECDYWTKSPNWLYSVNYKNLETAANNCGITNPFYKLYLLRPLLHELGHVLGLSHEMQNPNCPVTWYTTSSQYTKLSSDPDKTVSTAFNWNSVMMYDTKASENDQNMTVYSSDLCDLSKVDKEFIGSLYPFGNTVRLWHFIDENGREFYTTNFEENTKLINENQLVECLGRFYTEKMPSTTAYYRYHDDVNDKYVISTKKQTARQLKNFSDEYFLGYAYGLNSTQVAKAAGAIFLFDFSTTGNTKYVYSLQNIRNITYNGNTYNICGPICSVLPN